MNNLLSIIRESIPYIRHLRSITGSVTGCILMQQLDYWFARFPDGFYKFLEPPADHQLYRAGDSWTEELAFSKEEFRSAFDKVGVRYCSKSQYETAAANGDPFQGAFYLSYHNRVAGTTHYLRNHDYLDRELAELVKTFSVQPFPVNRESQSTVDREPPPRKSGKPISVNWDSQFTVSRESQFTFNKDSEITNSPEITHNPDSREKKKKQNSEPEQTQPSIEVELLEITALSKIKTIGEDLNACSAPPQNQIAENNSAIAPRQIVYDAALGIRPPRARVKFMYPDGPWLTDRGCMNEDFIRDRAQLWRTGDSPSSKAFGAMAIEDVLGLVCGRYMRDHAKLELDWQAYVAKNQRFLGNVRLRLDAGVEIPEAEQQEVRSKAPALAAAESEPVYEMPIPALPASESFNGARERLRQRFLPDSPSVRAQRLGRRSESTDDWLNRLRRSLADPILRPEALREVSRCEHLSPLLDEEGDDEDF